VADLSQASPPHILSASVLDEAMQKLMKLPHRTSFLDYTPAEGHAGHRAMGVEWLRRGGVEVSEQQVVVTSGAHGGLIAVLAALCKPGDAVLAEGLNYPTLKPIARHMGLTLIPLPADDEGLLPDELETQAASGIAKFIYIVPTLQNPTTTTLTAQRRKSIVEIARKHGLIIIEDDIFRLLAPPEQPASTTAGTRPKAFACSINSRPTVPWPAITSASSYGCTMAARRSAQSASAIASRSWLMRS
jgi:DNA-binding transcriptional MocR family regulator